MGRVRVTRARREALLNEFERGGTSGARTETEQYLQVAGTMFQ